MSKPEQTPPEDTAAETRRRMARELRRLGEQDGKITGGAGLPDEREEEPDAVEVWARRTGRALGYLFAAWLLWHLFSTYIVPR